MLVSPIVIIMDSSRAETAFGRYRQQPLSQTAPYHEYQYIVDAWHLRRIHDWVGLLGLRYVQVYATLDLVDEVNCGLICKFVIPNKLLGNKAFNSS